MNAASQMFANVVIDPATLL